MDLVARISAGFLRVGAEFKAVRRDMGSIGAPVGTITYTAPLQVGSILTSHLPVGALSADRQWTRDGVGIDGETGETRVTSAADSQRIIGCVLTNIVWEAASIAVPYLSGAVPNAVTYNGIPLTHQGQPLTYGASS